LQIDETPSLYTHINFGIGGNGEYPRIAYLKNHPETPAFMLTRDPADTLVSYYHDDMVRGQKGKMKDVRGDIDAYCRENLSHLQQFYQSASEYNYVATLRYEDMIADTYTSILPLFETVYKDLDKDLLAKAVEKCEFDNVAKKERSGELNMRVRSDHMEAGFYKTRKGKVGSAKEELTAETFEWIQEQLSK
jgi:hypothetical protein